MDEGRIRTATTEEYRENKTNIYENRLFIEPSKEP